MKPILLSKKKLDELSSKLIQDLSYFSGKKIVYLDYPVHNNIGDHLIYSGAMNALKANGNTIVGQFHADNYKRKEVNRLVKDHKAILVCHGGGNFGDIYSKHQDFRLQVLSDFPNQQLVIMPQSVFYQSKTLAASQLALFANKFVTIHVRDNDSYELLKSHNVNVYKTPDCAHALVDDLYGNNNTPLLTSNDTKTLVFRRRDSESVKANGDGFDWDDIVSSTDRFAYKAFRKLSKSARLHSVSLNVFQPYSNRLIEKARDKFDRYDLVDTDRLHGFILAALMGKKIIHKDNSYGKIHKYSDTWVEK